MVVASPNNPTMRSEKIRVVELPTIDLSCERSEVSRLLVKASEEYGFFMVTNHGVPQDIIAAVEDESFSFFAKPMAEKLKAGPPNPFGYGCKNIGFNGDMGEVEYLLLTTNHIPKHFSSALSSYVHAVTQLGCEILDLMAEGLWVPDTSVFSTLIRAVDCDSLLRLNHYPPVPRSAVGFGEHSDPQILTLLRSNGVGGLQISPEQGVWVPVRPDPTAFCVNVGDALQVMTNGRFVSVRHRVMTNSNESRMSMAYFCGPPVDARIVSLPEMVTPMRPCLYRPFTWAEYKKTAYSLRLGQSRLELFANDREDHE